MLWSALLIVGILTAGIAFWWWRRRSRYRLISFVALLREPVAFDPAVLAKVAGKVWEADLGDGTAEGADGFVVGVGITNTIMHEGRMFLINSFPTPYTEDAEKAAKGITDRRIRSLFCKHRAWFSCDAMGVDASTPEHEVRRLYQRLGPLFAELLDTDSLLIFLPDSERAYPINEDTEMALRSEDPLTQLQETLTLPVIEVANDDPLMKRAVAQARESWPQMIKAYEANLGSNFSVKAPVTHGRNTEFIWIAVTSIEGERIYGELGNEPANLGPLKLGSKVSVPIAELNDWCYVDPQENLMGGFTIKAVQHAAKRRFSKGGPN
jgi:uncharacterized protein YegJ (DUF2314 family)